MIRLSTPDHETSVCDHDEEIEIPSQWDGAKRFEELSSCHDFLLAFVNSKLPSRVRRHVGASDIVQSVLFIVSQKHTTFRGDSEAEFRAWIFQIARRKIIDGIRRFRSRSTTIHPSSDFGLMHSAAFDDESPSECLSLEEDARVIIAAINGLPADVRQIVTLRYAQNLTFEQIGAQLNLPATTCRCEWMRGCEDLKQRLGGLLP